MRRPLILSAALLVTCLAAAVAGPAAAAPAKHRACKAPDGAFVLKPGGKPLQQSVATPVGAVNSLGSPIVDMATVVGDFYVDLAGRPVSTRGVLNLELAWDNDVSDYDLYVNGTTELSSDNPEGRREIVKHCVPVPVKVDVFYGVPVDELTLTTRARVV